MVDLYRKLIITKRKTFAYVPDVFKTQVAAKLQSMGYDTKGNPLSQ